MTRKPHLRVFISHQRRDEETAREIAEWLQRVGVGTYLDVLDPHLASDFGDDLGEYFRQKLGQCTHLMAVVSRNTITSWWVPFEIGIATEKQYPIATYAAGQCELPDYLTKWPYLLRLTHLVDYLVVAETTHRNILLEGLETASIARRGEYSREFHRELKRALGQ